MASPQKTKTQLIAEVKKLQRKIKLLHQKSPSKKQTISKTDKPWSSLFKHSGNLVAIIDKKLTIVDINKSNRKKAIGQKAYYSVTGESKKVVKKAIEKVFKTAKTQGYVVSSNALLGELVYVSCKATPIIDNGKVINVVVEATDITKEVEAQNSLKQSEEKFKMLAENAFDLIYRYSIFPTNKYEYVSSSAYAITGYKPKDFYADPLLGFKMVHPNDRHLLGDFEKFLKRNTSKINGPTLILRWVKKNGAVIWTETRNKPIFNISGKLIAVEGISRDITQQKQYEQELTQSRENYKSVIDYSPDGVIIHIDGKIKFANPSALKITGVDSFEELDGISVIEYILPEYHEKIREQLKKINAGEQLDFVEVKLKNLKG